MWGSLRGAPSTPSIRIISSARVKDGGVFDNLKSTRVGDANQSRANPPWT